MDFSVGTVAKRVMIIIVVLSGLIIVGGAVYYRSAEVLPFAIGVVAAMAINIIKVLWLKRAVTNAVNMETTAGKQHMQMNSFGRMILTLAVLFVAGYFHGRGINLFGAAISIFTFTIAMYTVNIFFKGQQPSEHK